MVKVCRIESGGGPTTATVYVPAGRSIDSGVEAADGSVTAAPVSRLMDSMVPHAAVAVSQVETCARISLERDDRR